MEVKLRRFIALTADGEVVSVLPSVKDWDTEQEKPVWPSTISDDVFYVNAIDELDAFKLAQQHMREME